MLTTALATQDTTSGQGDGISRFNRKSPIVPDNRPAQQPIAETGGVVARSRTIFYDEDNLIIMTASPQQGDFTRLVPIFQPEDLQAIIDIFEYVASNHSAENSHEEAIYRLKNGLEPYTGVRIYIAGNTVESDVSITIGADDIDQFVSDIASVINSHGGQWEDVAEQLLDWYESSEIIEHEIIFSIEVVESKFKPNSD